MRLCFAIVIPGVALPAILDLSQVTETVYEINRINVPVPGRRLGYGRHLLSQCLAQADDEGITLRLTINPSGKMSYDELQAWYERNGFVYDPRVDSPNRYYFVREPQSEDP